MSDGTPNEAAKPAEKSETETPKSEPPAPTFEPERQVARQHISKSAQALIQWMPLGGSGSVLVSFLLEQNWAMAIATFPVTIVTVIWAAYTESFLTRFREVAQKRGKEDVDALMAWQQNLDEAMRWQLAGTAEKYLRCQGNACRDYTTEGMASTFKPQLKDVFVPLELSGDFWRGRDGESLPMPPGLKWDQESLERLAGREGLRIWDVLQRGERNPAYRCWAIQAWGGYGKTTLLRHITYTYTHKCDGRYNAPKLLPVLLYLRQWQEVIHTEKPDLPTLIEKYHIPKLPEGKDLKLPPNWAKNQLKQGKMLVMWDGFDEVREEWRQPMSLWMAGEMNAYPKSWFLLTSRPGGYKSYVAETKPNSLFVKAFNDDQQKRFIQRWYESRERHYSADPKHRSVAREAAAKSASLVQQLRERPELNDLAKNPLLLNIIVNLHSFAPCDPIDPARPIQLPQRRAELYREILRLQLGDRPLVKQISLLLSAEDSQKVLQKLALYMVRANEPTIEYSTLLEKLKGYLAELDESILPAAFLKQIEQVSELLVKRDESYEFAHLSFQGYLAALEIKEQKQEHLLLKHYSEAWWKETILLYAAQVSTPQLSILIRQLCEIGTPEAVALAYYGLQESPRRVTPELEAELTKLRYQPLETYLKQQEWKEADKETWRLMLQTKGKEEEGWLSIEDIDNFPCEDLRILDGLWVKYSNGRFGFSVQKEIYQSLGGTREYNSEIWQAFGEAVGWYVEGDWLYYNDLTFDLRESLTSERGHLPRIPGDGWMSILMMGGLLISSLASRLVKCNI